MAGTVVYNVKNPDIRSVCFEQDVYPVKDGKVELPAGATFYASLVASGELFLDAPGAGVIDTSDGVSNAEASLAGETLAAAKAGKGKK